MIIGALSREKPMSQTGKKEAADEVAKPSESEGHKSENQTKSILQSDLSPAEIKQIQQTQQAAAKNEYAQIKKEGGKGPGTATYGECKLVEKYKAGNQEWERDEKNPKLWHVKDGNKHYALEARVEKDGDHISAKVKYENGRAVTFKDGSPAEILHPNGEKWTANAKDPNKWDVLAPNKDDPKHPHKMQVSDVKVNLADGDIKWHVISGIGQGHDREIDQKNQYHDSPGQSQRKALEPMAGKSEVLSHVPAQQHQSIEPKAVEPRSVVEAKAEPGAKSLQKEETAFKPQPVMPKTPELILPKPGPERLPSGEKAAKPELPHPGIESSKPEKLEMQKLPLPSPENKQVKHAEAVHKALDSLMARSLSLPKAPEAAPVVTPHLVPRSWENPAPQPVALKLGDRNFTPQPMAPKNSDYEAGRPGIMEIPKADAPAPYIVELTKAHSSDSKPTAVEPKKVYSSMKLEAVMPSVPKEVLAQEKQESKQGFSGQGQGATESAEPPASAKVLKGQVSEQSGQASGQGKTFFQLDVQENVQQVQKPPASYYPYPVAVQDAGSGYQRASAQSDHSRPQHLRAELNKGQSDQLPQLLEGRQNVTLTNIEGYPRGSFKVAPVTINAVGVGASECSADLVGQTARGSVTRVQGYVNERNQFVITQVRIDNENFMRSANGVMSLRRKR